MKLFAFKNVKAQDKSPAASKAFLELDQIQGKRGIWFCGTYQGCGFHEDGLKAGKAAAQSLLGKKIGPLANPKQMVLSWTETGARLLELRFLNQYISVGNLILFEEGGTMFNFGEACEKKMQCKICSASSRPTVLLEGGNRSRPRFGRCLH
ncbi:hypothetical protein E2562_015221 [Oryza meyeriana var. granulata]|uniref:Amine oxidase domain-containing protein n=1 Tax=Oryza meyeriana var. granulata TaxID=110450 RepID=A0A6G1EWV6_9ORYZ|nr:hypothetical protein E2562_015221 [Oryza meyeriana var. granulata]KAF0929116.1 hypothetical protein E2562_015221 [Oryza meyeriana var. granulata]KAF0929117.1 hypothetical protein E2562_015221 [Oryza meyeriana var. granulata]